MFNSKSHWSWVPELQIRMIAWEDEIVLFNLMTQDTHLLNKPSDWILAKLKNDSLSLDELTESAIRQNIISNNEDSSLAMNNFLTCLKEIDLIELRSNQCEDNTLA